MAVIRPDRIIVTADATGAIASLAPSPGVAFKVEPCNVDDKGNVATPGRFPMSVYFDGDQTRLFPVVQAGLEVLGGDGANVAFSSMGAIRATPNGTYLVTVYKTQDQGSIPGSPPAAAEQLIYSSAPSGKLLIGANPGPFALGPSGSRAGIGGNAPSFAFTWASATCWDVSAWDIVRVRLFTVPPPPSGGMTSFTVDVESWPTVNGPADAALYAQPYTITARAPPYLSQTETAAAGSMQMEIGTRAGAPGLRWNASPDNAHTSGSWPVKVRYLRLSFNVLGGALAADTGTGNRWVEVWGENRS